MVRTLRAEAGSRRGTLVERGAVASVNKVLQKEGITTASSVSASYTHEGKMTAGGGGSSKGVLVKKAGRETRLSYSHGFYSGLLSERQKQQEETQLSSALTTLHKAGFETKPLGYLRNTYLVQKPPKT